MKIILQQKENKGITLIALVITILILLILAGITIAALSGDNGILKKTVRTKEETEKAEIIEQIRLDIYEEMSNNMGKEITESEIEIIASRYGEIKGETFVNKILITSKGKYEIKLSEIWTTDKLQVGETATAEKNKYESDEKIATIPEAFKVSDKEGETSINGGLVVYAPDGSEYVWIPVDGIIGEEGKTVQNAVDGEIILGRYVFKSNGTIDTSLTPETIGTELKKSSSDTFFYTENTIGNGNAVATGEEGINSFIESVRKNGGYYIGRYEAGDINATSNRTDISSDNNPLLVKSELYVYNEITQAQASELCQELYLKVNSDLINSYAWDTAILFIQKYGTESNSSTYSRQNGISITKQQSKTGKSILEDTNKEDKQCNIYDMAGNCYEWTTESYSNPANPCVNRGGGNNDNNIYTSYRLNRDTFSSNSGASFRPILYL